MPVEIQIPTQLRSLTGNQATVAADGSTARDALGALAAQYPEIEQHLFDDQGALRRFVALFLNGDNIRDPDTPVSDGDTLAIIPAIAGGGNAC